MRANKQLEAARRTEASSSCLRCLNHISFLGIQTTFCQARGNISVIHVDTVQNAGRQWKIRQLHAIHRIPTVLLAKDALKNSQEKENAPIPKQKVGPCDQLFCVEF